MDETFSSIDLVTQCLADEKRTLPFQRAIEEVVRSGDMVLDVGTGSSILALFAARAGAKKVVAVEIDPYVALLAKQNIRNNNLEDVIELVNADIRALHLTNNRLFDVVIMEMLTTGMIDEHQVWAVNVLHQKGLVKESTKFIPCRQDTFFALAQTDFNAYGFTMRMVKHLWEPFPPNKFERLTDTHPLNSISFARQNTISFSGIYEVDVKKGGTINSICLTSKTILNSRLSIADTLSLNAPVIVPLEKDYAVQKGDKFRCKITYEFGGGFRNFRMQVDGL